jgi:rubrerythrin
MADWKCKECGYETGNVRCKPAACPECGEPKIVFEKKH